MYENHGQDHGSKRSMCRQRYLARDWTEANNLPLVNHVEAIPIHDYNHFKGKRGDNNDGKGNGFGIGNDGDPSNTLTRNDRHVVAINEGVNMVVRRLTPTECERLQGFPRWLDSNTLERQDERGLSRWPRFKAMGNSMAVPVMRWIGGLHRASSIVFQKQKSKGTGVGVAMRVRPIGMLSIELIEPAVSPGLSYGKRNRPYSQVRY